jgi:DNA-binding FadR family transcriptional regulator
MVIYQLMQTLQPHFDRVRSLSLITIPHDSVIEDHEAIFACIREQNAPEAKKLIASHLLRYKIDAVSIQKAYPQYFV